jgi:hypothetical protein
VFLRWKIEGQSHTINYAVGTYFAGRCPPVAGKYRYKLMLVQSRRVAGVKRPRQRQYYLAQVDEWQLSDHPLAMLHRHRFWQRLPKRLLALYRVGDITREQGDALIAEIEQAVPPLVPVIGKYHMPPLARPAHLEKRIQQYARDAQQGLEAAARQMPDLFPEIIAQMKAEGRYP